MHKNSGLSSFVGMDVKVFSMDMRIALFLAAISYLHPQWLFYEYWGISHSFHSLKNVNAFDLLPCLPNGICMKNTLLQIYFIPEQRVHGTCRSLNSTGSASELHKALSYIHMGSLLP